MVIEEISFRPFLSILDFKLLKMATADTDIDLLDSNFKSLYCSICYCIFKLPKVLPCQHTFCYHCLESYINSKNQNLSKGKKVVHFPCPICQRPIQSRNDSQTVGKWAAHFETNLTFISIIDDLLANKRQKESRPLCDIHSIKRVKYFCRVCNVLLCSLCTAKKHKNCAVVQTLSEAVIDMLHTKFQLSEQLKTKKTELQKVCSDLEKLRASTTANKKQLIREIENDAEFIAKVRKNILYWSFCWWQQGKSSKSLDVEAWRLIWKKKDMEVTLKITSNRLTYTWKFIRIIWKF